MGNIWLASIALGFIVTLAVWLNVNYRKYKDFESNEYWW